MTTDTLKESPAQEADPTADTTDTDDGGSAAQPKNLELFAEPECRFERLKNKVSNKGWQIFRELYAPQSAAWFRFENRQVRFMCRCLEEAETFANRLDGKGPK